MEKVTFKFTLENVPKELLDQIWYGLMNFANKDIGAVILPSNDIKYDFDMVDSERMHGIIGEVLSNCVAFQCVITQQKLNSNSN